MRCPPQVARSGNSVVQHPRQCNKKIQKYQTKKRITDGKQFGKAKVLFLVAWAQSFLIAELLKKNNAHTRCRSPEDALGLYQDSFYLVVLEKGFF
jgi:hypothetical protein